MANIVIDGYNLIGIAHKNLEKARNDLIQRLSKYAGIKGHNIIVVFDGWRGGQAEETKEKRGNITVIYSGLGEKADNVIKNMLVSSTEPWIAVSSDRDIYKFAEKKSFVAVTRDEFEAKLDSVLNISQNDGAGEYLEEDEYIEPATTGKKGNPRKFSKKDKRKMAVMKKL